MSYPLRETRGILPWLSDVFRHTSPATVPQYTCFFRNFKCFFALFLDKSCTCCRLLAADRPDRPSPCAAFLYMIKSVILSAPFPPGAGKEREPKGSRSQRVKKASQSSAARRRRKKIKSFFRRRVRRKNTLRGASVESSAMGGRPRRGAQRNLFGGKGVSLFRQSRGAGRTAPRREKYRPGLDTGGARW